MLHPVISERAADLERLCRRYRVRRLALFGSAATGRRLDGGKRPRLSGGVRTAASRRLRQHVLWFVGSPAAAIRQAGGSGSRVGHQEPVLLGSSRGHKDAPL